MTVTMCEQCDDTGWRQVMVDGVRRYTRCACFLEARPKVAEGVPLEFRDARFETFEVTPANKAASAFAPKWLAESTRDLFLFGSVGSGKTRLACSIANEAQQGGTVSLFVRVPMFLLRLQPSGDESELLWKAVGVPLLVLDDLGAERETASDFTRRTLLLLYEARHDAGLRTIWTSNQSLVEIGEFMQDERLASRIKGQADVVELSGKDWRVGKRVR